MTIEKIIKRIEKELEIRRWELKKMILKDRGVYCATLFSSFIKDGFMIVGAADSPLEALEKAYEGFLGREKRMTGQVNLSLRKRKS